MTPGWTLAVSLLVVGSGLLVTELWCARRDLAAERAERERLQVRLAGQLRERRQLPAPWTPRGALPPPAQQPTGELDTKVIDRPYESAVTAESPVIPIVPTYGGQQ